MAENSIQSEYLDVRSSRLDSFYSSPTQASFSRWVEDTGDMEHRSSMPASPYTSPSWNRSGKRIDKQKTVIDMSSFSIDSFVASTSRGASSNIIEEIEFGTSSLPLRLPSFHSQDETETISTPRLLSGPSTPYGSTKWEDEGEGRTVVQLDPEWYEQVNRRVSEATRQRRSAPCTIYKQHRRFSQKDQWLRTAQEPNIVSVGPYHRYVPRLRSMEEVKYLCLRELLQQSGDQSPAVALELCLVEMKRVEARARSCYSEPIEMRSNEFAEMMLLDGCFVIYVLLMAADKKEATISLQRDLSFRLRDPSHEEEMGQSAEAAPPENSLRGRVRRADEESAIFSILRSWNMVRCDLIILDNQIPFFIIHALWQLLRPLKIPPEQLAINLFRDLYLFKTMNYSPEELGTVYHLLDLVHCMVDISFPIQSSVPKKEPAESIQDWIPSAKELKEVGILFRQKRNSRGFADITFNNGVIEIPQLSICSHSIVFFQNLIDFEHYFPNGNQLMTVYLKFMDSIMRSAEDVRLLQLKGIVVNRLGSDEDLARFFNGISAQIHHIRKTHYLQGLYEEVSSYHVSKTRKWKADLIRKHFNSPWTLISMIAASVLLILTAMQTYYAAFTFYKPK